jgi:hypothetical protein
MKHLPGEEVYDKLLDALRDAVGETGRASPRSRGNSTARRDGILYCDLYSGEPTKAVRASRHNTRRRQGHFRTWEKARTETQALDQGKKLEHGRGCRDRSQALRQNCGLRDQKGKCRNDGVGRHIAAAMEGRKSELIELSRRGGK